MVEHICTKCNKTKPNIDFPKGRRCCLECMKLYKTNWKRINRSKNKDGSKTKHISKYDLTGKRFGKLLVIASLGIKEYLTNGKRITYFLCKCDCGIEITTPGVYLKNGKKKSCGCLVHDRQREKSPIWTGHKGISGSSWNKIERNAINNRRNKRRNLEFTITKEYVWDLFEKQNGKCALTGLDIILDVGSNVKIQTASLDRIDSSKGYSPDNVQWVHKDINLIKMDLNQKDFIELCKRVAVKAMEREAAEGQKCPGCGSEPVYADGCVSCSCGWSKCS